MLNIIAAVLVFGLIVLVHEFGHFLLAKLNGIGVVEFSIGMGPRLCSWQRGETRYSLKILPFGGSCMMLGEDEKDADPKAFNNKSVWARISVVFAGPAFNFILAFLFAVIIVMNIGYQKFQISDVTEGSPAAEAGLQPGDVITRVNSRKITAYEDVQVYAGKSGGDSPHPLQPPRRGRFLGDGGDRADSEILGDGGTLPDGCYFHQPVCEGGEPGRAGLLQRLPGEILRHFHL